MHLLVRSEKMRASRTLQERVLSHPKVTVHFNTNVVDAFPDRRGTMAGLNLQNRTTESDLAVRGLFYGIGHKPNSELISGQVALDSEGYVTVTEGRVHDLYSTYGFMQRY